MNEVAVIIPSLILAMVVVLIGCTTINPPVALVPSPRQAGVYEFEVGNSLYPKSRGASVGFEQHLTARGEVTGSLEWKGNDSMRYKWSLYVYAPHGSAAFGWSGADLKHNFRFTATTSVTWYVMKLRRVVDKRVI